MEQFQEELQRCLCSPADSRSWLPRRLFIRLQGGTRDKRENRNKGSAQEERKRERETLQWARGEESSRKIFTKHLTSATYLLQCSCWPEDGSVRTQNRAFHHREAFSVNADRTEFIYLQWSEGVRKTTNTRDKRS